MKESKKNFKIYKKQKKYYKAAFYFLNMGRYAVSPVDRSAFEYSDVDDKFYVIVYDGKNKRPQLAYNMKVYQWKE